MQTPFTDYSDLLLAAVNAVIVIALAVQLGRLGIRVTGPAGALLVYFTLRGAARLADAPQIPPRDNSVIGQVIDGLSLLAALYLLTQTRRLVDTFRVAQNHARLHAIEYERARHHYMQIVRHRMMNPLTIITGTLQTLRDGPPLQPQMRVELCDSALTAAGELTDLSLAPERRDELEYELNAIPRPPEPPADDDEPG